ncbi:protein lifeguard 3-like isoform X2 [Tenebrio molitor]|uniref:protein lifeguard 3-like isoform X2 n=1 Tax=Tenebrio molitor TaxID=7067 RepID=UPI0036248E9B
MEDIKNDGADKTTPTVIQLEPVETKIEINDPSPVVMPFWQNQPQQPPPYNPNYPPLQQNYYYNDPSYNQRGTPAYQQRGGPGYEPPNVSRGQPAYRANDPQEAQQSQFWRNSEIFTDAFNTTAIRNRFVQRVYIILALQLFITFGFIIFATFHIDTKLFFAENKLVISIVSMVMYLILYLALACCVDLRRNFPVNFIMLGLLTVALTLLMTTLTAFSSPVVVLAAIGTTAIVCTLVSIFACQTKWDVTGCGMCLCIAMIVMMIFGLITMILSLAGIHLPIMHVIYSALSTLLFCFWLMYDTQQIVGGRRIEMSPEEYIFGALCLYVDIMYIFMHILVLYQYCLGEN